MQVQNLLQKSPLIYNMWSLRYMVGLVFGLSRYAVLLPFPSLRVLCPLFYNRVTVEWLERRSIDPPSSLQVSSSLLCNTGKLLQCSLTAEDFSVAFLLCPIDGSVGVLHEIPVFFDEEEDRSLRRVETSFW